jgi:Ca2+-transporting ATPase
MSNWHTLESSVALSKLESDLQTGLSAEDAARRLAEHGPNELIEKGAKSPWLILWEQFKAVLIVVLIIAAIASAILGDLEDTIAILTIVILNAILGFRQEHRAEKAMAALKKLSVPKVKVRREGSLREISTRELVPGDIVILEAGNLVPTDCRLLEAINLRTQEAALTGESEPVDKTAAALSGDQLPLGDRLNMAYMGTLVAYGRGTALVTDTGMDTELGHIATMIQSTERQPTPLQRRLDQLGKKLVIGATILVAIIFVEGLITGEEVKLMLLTAVSIAVAAVPEGLPAVVTIALALGAQRMLKRNALIRKLPAVETLGSVTVICSDKTGTLTENRMTVTVLDIAGHRIDLTQEMRQRTPRAAEDQQESALLTDQPTMALLLAGGSLCSDAVVEYDEKEAGRLRVVGEPTEGALVMAATRNGLWKGALEGALPRLAEVPFDSTRKRMTTLHQAPADENVLPDSLKNVWQQRKIFNGAKFISFTKGAIDSLLDISTEVWAEDRRQPLTDEWRQRITEAHDKLAQDGMRILAIGLRAFPDKPQQTDGEFLERDLVLVGLIGMMDPARPEVRESVRECRAAGIRPVMITGDHPLTAGHIARELGIADDDIIVTGAELTANPDRLADVENISVFARVSPEHKLEIVGALQERGHQESRYRRRDGYHRHRCLKRSSRCCPTG